MKRFFFCLWITLGLLGMGSPAWAGWDERISLFDPIGPLFDPLEEAIPGLMVKGMVRHWTRMATHRRTYDPQVGRRVKDFPSIEWLGELELRYQASPNLEIVNIENFLYDSAFRWDSGGPYSHSTRKDLKYYHTTDRILRELYAVYYYDDILDFKLGKQQLVWGKMDGRVIDIINPSDNRYNLTGNPDNFEWTRVPLWMANVIYTFGNYYLQLLWIPDFEANYNAPSDGPFRSISKRPRRRRLDPPPTNFLLTRDKPSQGFLNSEWGLRFNLVKGRWDLSFVYFYNWDDNPTSFRREVAETLDPAGTVVRRKFILEPRHARIHQFGLDLDQSFQLLGRNILLKGEAVYTLNSHFPLTEREPLPRPDEIAPSRRLFKHPARYNGVKKSNQLLAAVNLETRFRGDVTLNTQLQFRHIFGYNGRMRTLGRPQEKDRLDVIFGANKFFKFTDNRLGIFWTNAYIDSGSWRERFDVKYALSDYVDLMVRYWAFWGNRNSPYGMFQDRDELELFLKYEF